MDGWIDRYYLSTCKESFVDCICWKGPFFTVLCTFDFINFTVYLSKSALSVLNSEGLNMYH